MIRVYPLTNMAVFSTSTLIEWEGKRMLVDVGPGSLLRMMDQRLPLSKVDLVLISHSHIDHFWDLVPLLWFKSIRGLRRRIKVLGPEEDRPLLEWLVEVSQGKRLAEVVGLKDGWKAEFDSLRVEAFRVRHETSETPLGFLISEKPRNRLDTQLLTDLGVPKEYWAFVAGGKPLKWAGRRINPEDVVKTVSRKIVYTGDTEAHDSIVEKAAGADLLIAEATFLSDDDKLASGACHMTVRDALKLAKEAKVRKLLLTHHSLRYSLENFTREVEALTARLKPLPFEVHLGLKAFTI